MQFGHNDNGSLDGPKGSVASLPGSGDETQTWNAETVHTFGWYLRQYIAEARAEGATPIVCSLIPRKIWTDGKINRDSSSYGKWAAEVAQAQKTAFIDLNEIVAREYDKLGPEKVEPLFADPHTHTSRAGAEVNARVVAAGLKPIFPDAAK
jgi:lysophospholipase L1-like esterase